MTTSVQDRLTITLPEARAYLRVDHDDDDTLISALVDAAKASADAYLNNPFMSDGDPLPIPEPVRLWVLRRAALSYESRLESARGDEVSGLGSIDYGIRDEGGSRDMSLLRPYRLNPGL